MSGKYAFTKSLKEVRFLFCQTSDHSAATRFVFPPPSPPFLSCLPSLPSLSLTILLSLLSIFCFPQCRRTTKVEQLLAYTGNIYSFISTRSFLSRAYPTMKKNNPHTPIMLREALGTEPRVFTRYGMRCSPSLNQISWFAFLRKSVFSNFVEMGTDEIETVGSGNRIWQGEATVTVR